MSKLLKVILIFDDKTMIAKGEEATKWDSHCRGIALLARVHGMNPFDTDPVKWIKSEKSIDNAPDPKIKPWDEEK